MEKKLLTYVRALINHCYISSNNALIATLEKQIPFVDIEIRERAEVSDRLFLLFDFEKFQIPFVLVIEKRDNNSFLIKDIFN